MNNRETRLWLDERWSLALSLPQSEPDPEVDELVNSEIASIRYALVTQLLGKIADRNRCVLALQLGEAAEGSWDARSFASSVIVPWERDNQQILGKSPDPYVSNPLRRPRLDDNANLRNKATWDRLVEFLEPLDDAPDDQLERAFWRVLLSLARRLTLQSFSYPVPQRISQARLEDLVASFLAEPSGGLRPLAVTAALFKTIGTAFQLFSEVRSQGINEADSATGVPGDIICIDQSGDVCLAVEVKDVSLKLAHIQEASRKAKQSGNNLSGFLFAAPGLQQADSDRFKALTHQNWAEGLNIYTVTIEALLGTTLVLLHESWRVKFVRELCRELDDRQNQPARRGWFELLGRGDQ